jgi:hypothetical protein
MRTPRSYRSKMHSKSIVFALFLAGVIAQQAHAKTGRESPGSLKSDPSAKLLLEVMNWHFTIGRKIPSAFLRVYSDGSVECHALQYSGEEKDVIKTQTLTTDKLDRMRVLISRPELLRVKNRFELTSTVTDSWMEWDINIPRADHVQHIEVAHRSADFPLWPDDAYPRVLFELGCSVWKLRNDVYADAFPCAGCDKYRAAK